MNDSEKALLDLVPTPLFVLEVSRDGDVMYTYFNKVALDVAKFSLSDYVGLNAMNLYEGKYGEFAYQKHVECFLTSQASTYLLQLPIDGKVRSISTRLMPVVDGDGLVTRIIGASTELTAEHELDKVRVESQSIEDELQEFVYLAAHDLRSPMKKVRLFADMLREDFKDLGDGKLDLIHLLEKISIETMTMIQAMLRYAQAGGTEEPAKAIRLLDVCNGILSTLDPTMLNTYRIDDCSVVGDYVLIQTVLRNLIDNALKHNEPNAVSIDISVKNASAESYFTLSVIDNGKGMEAPCSLFANTDRERSMRGFGLRAISKLITNAGGDIVAEHSYKGAGLAVTATLPGRVN